MDPVLGMFWAQIGSDPYSPVFDEDITTRGVRFQQKVAALCEAS